MSVDLDRTETLDLIDVLPEMPSVVEASMPVGAELRTRRPNALVTVVTVVGALLIAALYIGVPLSLGLQSVVEQVPAAGGIAAGVLVLLAVLVLAILRRTARDRRVASPVPTQRAGDPSTR